MRNYSFGLIIIAIFITTSTDAARKRISDTIVSGVYSEADIEKEILFGREMAALILAANKLSGI